METYKVFIKGGMELIRAGKSVKEVRQELENKNLLVLCVVNTKHLNEVKQYV